ncbi:MAG: prolyl oligopeptidase family serine peptidase [Rhodococcus sp. (in: high G+C Gram-positive bacteria)]|nr:prolyl oligopeptidase family serine peptidase [Rhodococcus sp. (in: high G+C Gram-positive bacteria)]MDI6628002.1 prolyl oligopeptidase family serine peptidase [Rhodococcus sp. (in: high G+C Gram-positive bacteria)]
MSARIKIAYGDHPEQFGHLYLPAEPMDHRTPVVVVVHGGFWSGQYGSSLGTQFARAVAAAGAVAWNIEYRRVGAGGHWPEMQSDVTAALDVVAGELQHHAPVGIDDVRVIGHSAGGHLAAWLGGETGTKVRPSRIVSQAGVLDLEPRGASGRTNPAVEALLQARYEDDPELYRSASPAARTPIGIPTIALHGSEDIQVPAAQSERYVALARAAGDDARLTIVPGEDHFAFLNPDSRCWALSLDAVIGATSE